MTPEEFIDRCDWEGGIWNGIFGYGLKETDLDRTEGEFYDAVKELSSMRERIQKLTDIINSYEE